MYHLSFVFSNKILLTCLTCPIATYKDMGKYITETHYELKVLYAEYITEYVVLILTTMNPRISTRIFETQHHM